MELTGAALPWTVGLFGLFVGSFLNVAIHRLPLPDETVARPKRSRCPSCKTTLSWSENVPVLSWALQRGRCRTCGWAIPWRYPLVELLTALVFALAAARTPEGEWGLLAVRLLALGGLIVATFVDFDRFEIPDEVSIGGIVLAPVCSLLVPELHARSWIARALSPAGAADVERTAALAACLAGMLAGAGVLWGIGRVGRWLYGREAMGFGDVKLMTGAGGLVGPGGVLVALMIASLVASVAGIGNMLRYYAIVRRRARARRRPAASVRAFEVARIAGRYVPFGPYLALGIGIVLLCWNDVLALVSALAGT